MAQNTLNRSWPNSQLNTAISCLTYGINCLYFDRTQNQLRSCLLTIHQQYINIIHVIIQGRVSLLFQLQHVKSISNKDIFVRQTLKQIGYEYFLILYTSALESHVLVMQSQNQINVLWEGLEYFVYQANNFYSRISLNDPFKAETTMLFMDADVDGSKLLDIGEVMQIFHKLKINKDKKEIEEAVKEINLDLYEKENLKKPKDFSNDKLTPLGFQYILQFYSLKVSLSPLFTEVCPIFKFKHKQFKKSIIDILKSQTKPLMSAIQFQQFLAKYMKMSLTESECLELITTFPIYDGYGKEIPQEIEYLSFRNFCNFVFSQRNSLMDPKKMENYQDMNLPLGQYFIYSACMAQISKTTDSQLHMYEFALKKGCRCIEIGIHVEKQEIVVKYGKSKKYVLLADVLKTVKNIAFSFNHFPLIISVQCYFLPTYTDKVAQIFKTQVGDILYLLNPKDSRQSQQLPSPNELKNKIVLQLIGNTTKKKQQQNAFTKLFALMPAKLDFQRKGLTNWDTCQISTKDILKHEQIENKNLTDYSRKIIVRTSAVEVNSQMDNYDPMPMFRNGIQLIAQNIQKEDSYHYFMHSKFIENGGRYCGYLQKPNWMRADCLESLYATSFMKQQFMLKLKVYAGQKYVLTDTESKTFNLEICLKGTKIEEQKNKKYTSVPQNQGFYADFQMQCEFYIYCADLATLTFSVVNERHEILSFRAMPVSTIREGLRTVELLGPGMELNINSCFLVEAIIIEEKLKKKLASLLL